MKRIFALTGMMLAVCALACAQDDSGRIVVPARNSSRPRVVVASSNNGSITVKAYDGKEVIVESGNGRSRTSGRNGAPDGMHRIDVPDHGLVVEDDANTITVQDHTPGGTHITITVPPDTSLKLESHNGSVDVEGVHGEIDAECHNGGIKLLNVSGV